MLLSRGTGNETPVHPREVFRIACRSRAAALVLWHNHPSGNPSPSAADHDVTRRIAEAGELLFTELLDHVIVAEAGYYSYREQGLLPAP